jgi:hypothetical protein
MTLNLSAHLHKYQQRTNSTITNQIILNSSAKPPTSTPSLPRRDLGEDERSESAPHSETTNETPLPHYPSVHWPAQNQQKQSLPGQSPPIFLPSAPPVSERTIPVYHEDDPEDIIIAFKLKLLEILQKLFTDDVTFLNKINDSKTIILHVDDLYGLISILCNTQAVDIISVPVIHGCCTCAKNLMYAEIERIVVNGYDLMIAYNSAFNTLRSNNISLNYVIPGSNAM